MSVEHVVASYLQLRQELALAIAAERWESCRAGHIHRVSVEVGHIEDQLQASVIRDDVFAALISGSPELTDGRAH